MNAGLKLNEGGAWKIEGLVGVAIRALFAVWFLCLRGLWIEKLIGERIWKEIAAIDQVTVPSNGFIGRGKVANLFILAAQCRVD